MSYRSLRSTTLKTSFAQLDDYLLSQLIPDLGESLLLHEVEKHHNWLQCIKVDCKKLDVTRSRSKLKGLPNQDEGQEDKENPKGPEEDLAHFDPNDDELFRALRNNKLKKVDKKETFCDLNSLYDGSDDEGAKRDKEDKGEENDNRVDFSTSFFINMNSKPIALGRKGKAAHALVLEFYRKQNSILSRKKKIWLLSGLYSSDAKLAEDEDDSEKEKLDQADTTQMEGVLPKVVKKIRVKKEEDNYGEPFEHTEKQEFVKKIGKLISEKEKKEEEKARKNFKFALPESNILNCTIDYRLPWNVYSPSPLDDRAVNVEALKDFQLSEANNYQDKLPQKDLITINGGMPLAENEETVKQYNDLKTSNSRFSKQGVEVFDTDYKGYGLRALREYEPGSLVSEYNGDILTYQEFNNLKTTKDYCVHFIDGFVLDAGKHGSLARFINHSAVPNCYYDIFLDVKGTPRIGIFANSRGISTGEEVTLDYNTNKIYYIKPQRCFCGESVCKGFIRTFYKKLCLINFLSFNWFYGFNRKNELTVARDTSKTKSVGSGNGNGSESDRNAASTIPIDYSGIKSLIRSTALTTYPLRKLKKLSVFCSISTEEELHESYFYVVNSVDDRGSSLKPINVYSNELNSINYSNTTSYYSREQTTTPASELELGGHQKSIGRPHTQSGTAHRKQLAQDTHVKRPPGRPPGSKNKIKKTAAPRKRRTSSTSSYTKRPRQKRMKATNGTAEFNMLPESLKRQLGIDMVNL